MANALTISTAVKISGMQRIQVLMPLPLAGTYDYKIPANANYPLGTFVYVPLGNRLVAGVVWGHKNEGEIDEKRLKIVNGAVDVPAMPESVRRFVDWVADYTLSPPGAVLRMVMSVPKALDPPRSIVGVSLSSQSTDFRITSSRKKVLDFLADGCPRALKEISKEAGVSDGVIKGLLNVGALEKIALPINAYFPSPNPNHAGPTLSLFQKTAAKKLICGVQDKKFSVSLLDGVTGSGKTEVYFEAVAETLRLGRQVLVLIPEIALSAQWLERFQFRFGVRPIEWHSDLGQADRRNSWRGISESKVDVVVGARSALFLPFDRLGLIIVDEEHDGSFKQSDGVLYNARDMSVVRGKLEDCPVVLASATPSLESITNVRRGMYKHLVLPKRYAGASLPKIEIVDLRRHSLPRNNWLSQPLRDAVRDNIRVKQQSLLFLNRRGYAPLSICRACGYRLNCPNCSAWLVEHRFLGRLECHHCGFGMRKPNSCPDCGTEGALAACGPGVERLLEEVHGLFPDARVGLMTSDTVHGPDSAAKIFEKVHKHEIDILIGTQLVAKGHHFPLLTLVGVVDADLGLNGADLRAAERTYQVLHQVSGRAGRAEQPGRVFLQTYQPEHPVMLALVKGDRDSFIAEEIALRKEGVWPPFGRLVALILSGSKANQVHAIAKKIARAAPNDPAIRVLGPAPAPLAKLRGKHRWRLLVKTTRSVRVQYILISWLSAVKIPKNVRLYVDVDPQSFL